MRKERLHSFWTLILVLIFALPQSGFATHNRAGEITYYFTGPNTIVATISTWTKTSSTGADRDTLQISWGDGTYNLVPRDNGPIDPNGVPGGVPLANDVKYNIYTSTHTYPGAPPPPNNFYIISMTDPNRNSDIINISNSVEVQFYIEDTVFYPSNIQNIGYDHSPICVNPPIDYAYVGDTFWHNPAAYDPDGDSISFRMIIPLQAEGIVVPGYADPTTFIPGANNQETLNVHTGMYMWAVPQETGTYNVAFLISEYRRGQLLGTIDRDMQILVEVDTFPPPVVNVPADTCVWAGDPLFENITGTDPNASLVVTLTGYGGPLVHDVTIYPDSLSPATFTNNVGDTIITGNPARGNFLWNTVCLDIREQPYIFVFKAQSNNATNTGNPKVDLKTWQVHVIPPPPFNLTASATTNKKDIKLDWTNPYKCRPIHNFRGFSIWRRIGSNPFIPAHCEMGLAGRGYTMIASDVYDTSYVDMTVTTGQDYCYRILANFYDESPNGLYDYNAVVSVPSNEACFILPIGLPVITTVSVLQTDKVAGQMFVAWHKPLTGGNNLDTTIDVPPYRYDLYRGTGFNFGAPALIHSFPTSPTFAGLTDTTFTDTNLNTADTPYSYQVVFYANNGADTVGATAQASSVYLKIGPSDSRLNLSWNFNVPWVQDSFQIYRRDFTSAGAFRYIATDTSPTTLSYTDMGLINDSTYCYYIKSYGKYTSIIGDSLLTDSSEIYCAVPVDTIPPCQPTLTVTNDCNPYDSTFQYINYLTWIPYQDSCALNTVAYRIYYAADSGGSFTLIATITDTNIHSYNHQLDSSSLAGCYIITAVNKRGLESYKATQVCIEDCPNYNLPNTFTPNGDGINDFYTPYHPYRFITKVDFKIFTRWGEKVFETSDPEIKWDGKDQKTGKDMSDGVYLYAGYYYEKTLNGEIRKTLPHKNGGGFIHLIRSK